MSCKLHVQSAPDLEGISFFLALICEYELIIWLEGLFIPWNFDSENIAWAPQHESHLRTWELCGSDRVLQHISPSAVS